MSLNMRIHFKFVIFLYFCWEGFRGVVPLDESFLLKPLRLPNDLNFMPSLSNGHLGLTLFCDSIYMNGVYNGHSGESRRARLPNWLNITAYILNGDKETYCQPKNINYTMNLYKGVYEWMEEYTNLTLHMKQRVYAHRYFNRALIYELFIHRQSADDAVTIHLHQMPGPDTTAFNVENENSTLTNIKVLRATTRIKENEIFQANHITVYLAFSDDYRGSKKTLVMNSGEKNLYYRFVLTADLEKSVTLKEMENVLRLNQNILLEEHTSRWREFWKYFHIKVEGDEQLSQTINAGIFYMANSLPSLKSYQRNNPYFGLSPTGLGRGQLDDDYQGHSFWDTEIWMLPAVTLFQPIWSQELFKYRLDHLRGALYNANITGYKGARFPWESAYTGTEATNPCCPEVATQEIHISADIAVALQLFYATTYNRHWLCNTAWVLAREIAKFLQSRVTWRKQTQKFHIRSMYHLDYLIPGNKTKKIIENLLQDVMGPDEDHENVDDNVYTNVVFKKALEFASFTQWECDPNANTSALEWLNIANKMFILYDNLRDFHPQHLDYRLGDEIKQADTILLGYPLQYSMQNSTRLNDLQMYENVTRHSGPAMTWSMFSINYLDVGVVNKADHYFKRAYKNYVRPEFKVWSETEIGFKGSANFLTGIGGFLQAVIHGYIGLRYQLKNNTAQMLVKHTHLLPNTTKLTVKGVKFAGSLFEIKIEKSQPNTLTILNLGDMPLEIIVGTIYNCCELYEGFSIHFQTELIIQTKQN